MIRGKIQMEGKRKAERRREGEREGNDREERTKRKGNEKDKTRKHCEKSQKAVVKAKKTKVRPNMIYRTLE